MRCQVCQSSANFTCVACGLANYCSKIHQKQDWKLHKTQCKSYSVQQTSELGRFLIASRKIPKGCKIFSAQPIAVGPPINAPKATCLSCNKLCKKSFTKCSNCRFPFCNKSCLDQLAKFHEEECQILSEIDTVGYELILPLRIALLKSKDPEKFAKITTLQSNEEPLKKSSRWKSIEKNVIDKLKKRWNADTLTQICGIISTNSFETTEGNVWALFETPSLMNHDCVGNVRLVMDEAHKLEVFARDDIEKGQPLVFNYVKSLDTFEERQENLQMFKFFKCECKRCGDSTELETFSSSFLCPREKCKGGGAILNSMNCTSCHTKLSAEEMKRLNAKLEECRRKFHRMPKREKDLKLFHKHLLTFLHPNHGLIMELLLILIRLIQIPTQPQNNDPNVLSEILEIASEKGKYCEQVLKVLDILEPGLTLTRGIVLLEYQSNLVIRANVMFERDPSKPSELLNQLRNVKRLLNEAKSCLQMEPKTSPAFLQLQSLLVQEQDLNNYILMVADLC